MVEIMGRQPDLSGLLQPMIRSFDGFAGIFSRDTNSVRGLVKDLSSGRLIRSLLERNSGRRIDSKVSDLDMEKIGGVLKVRVIRGINLAIRDVGRRSSDPYVVLSLGHHKVKTNVVKRNCNPEWNEGLTLIISNPLTPLRLAVFDHDTFSADDKMGEAEIDMKPLLKCYNNMQMMLQNNKGMPQEGDLISTVEPNKQNCLARESHIVWKKDKVVQDMNLVLENVECGEVDIELELKCV